MASAAARFRSSISRHPIGGLAQYSASSSSNLEESIRAAVEAKAYQKIPQILNAAIDSCRNPNPFTFLSKFSESRRFEIIDEMLQSFISIRPRSQPRRAYSCLLSLTLDTSINHLPLALAVVQRTLRSGCLPPPQIHLLLAKSWLDRRRRQQAAARILSEMKLIGYSPDCGTCNYLILSLCKIDQFAEAIEVLRGMGRAGCAPDSDSFGGLINELSEARMVDVAVEVMADMVRVHKLSPRRETVVKAVAAMRANREARRAVEVVEMLEAEGVGVGFEAYESALEGCLDEKRFVLAGKFVVGMSERGFIPYLRVRLRLLEGLVAIGEAEHASVVRRRFAEMSS
ncbi:pentatricopeptide repeat-containing protein At1g06270 [Salvia miltiorrhiza]|uniref:pentatricopeptide repeat-containing protein At1g06270 n=1 Tax=Salvia miltiorrhiza TaxID=226208 RepID=UPI0025ACB987|nr:pentatricopeptide repeat-containing protein At1g06270 [Salvia miltiorrhiza]XP_057764186.1 pentatricopeptide repeat-containing protein At1g06270 [Salvia miltiorrhiza]XP_057764187.1 pentatricopeptide repeat-containing protein At1g06270 [Salvia miltiorrhiza]XP_057764188.1 pentatricopeptide repeat-containing protein At1g06270 [Salvia miltiorrhiza]XP_057764189.1 pentatricopeptide repeat-containing protein At1g06270 [Salvia miltiorrhiza]XP_057764191.1 pentatricopeptide repeat-containing protein A